MVAYLKAKWSNFNRRKTCSKRDDICHVELAKTKTEKMGTIITSNSRPQT